MKKLLYILLSLATALSCVYINTEVFAADNKLAAFPGAEGGGMYATGGRGGEVVHVTNLNDSGEGSFREAVSKPNRIVVFDVGGTIEVKSDVVIHDNTTVAGQTAPGGTGVTIKNGKIGLGGENIIVRFISSRPGEKGVGSGDYDALGGAEGSNSVIDHCSIGWANDEQFGLYSKNMHQTVQYTIIGPSNCVSYHSKGAHGFGAMFGKGQNSWHHNLLCHSLSRNFRGKVVGTESMDFVNNVIYDWGYQTGYGTLGHINYVNNYLKAGPSTAGGYHFMKADGSSRENYKFFLTGNKIVKADGSDYKAALNENNWNGGIQYTTVDGYTYSEKDYRTNTPFAVSSVNGDNVSVVGSAESAEEAYNTVTSYCGASVNPTDNKAAAYDYKKDSTRNKIDAQVLYETYTGTGSLTGARDFSTVDDSAVKSAISKYGITHVNYEEYYPTEQKSSIIDSDNDGMPDRWEIDRGLNPNDPSDALADYQGLGYNNIEYYINDLTVNAFPDGVVTVSPFAGGGNEEFDKVEDEVLSIVIGGNPDNIENVDDIILPKFGENGSTIIWSSSDEEIVIENNEVTSVKRSIFEKTLKLTATVSNAQNTVTLKKTFYVTIAGAGIKEISFPYEENFLLADGIGRWVISSDSSSSKVEESSTDIYGNATPKIVLKDKAVQLPLDNAIDVGKFTLSYDFLTIANDRSFRLYLDNAIHPYDYESGQASEFGTDNAFFHMFDKSGVYVSENEADIAAANATNYRIGSKALERNKWYRVVIDGDIDNNTVTVAFYRHGSDGKYNPDNISDEAYIKGSGIFTKGRDKSIAQIKFMSTNNRTVYFDNINLTVSGYEPPVPLPLYDFVQNGQTVDAFSDGNMEVIINADEDNDNAILITAQYGVDDNMLEARAESVSALEAINFSFDINTLAEEIKVFLWDRDSYCPLADLGRISRAH